MDSNQFNTDENESIDAARLRADQARLDRGEEARRIEAQRQQEETDAALQEDPRNVEEGIGGFQGLLKEVNPSYLADYKIQHHLSLHFQSVRLMLYLDKCKKKRQSLGNINLIGLLLVQMIIL